MVIPVTRTGVFYSRVPPPIGPKGGVIAWPFPLVDPSGGTFFLKGGIMPEMRPRPKADDGKVKVLECPNEQGLIADLDDMTIEDFESGSWRKKLTDANLDLEDMEFLTGILEGVPVRQVSEDAEPPADLIWIREIDGSLEIWKFGANVTPK